MSPDEDPTEVGEYPAVLMQDDFGIFSDLLDDSDKQAELLDEILWRPQHKGSGPGFDPSGLYTHRETLFDISLGDEWDSFCRQIKKDPTAQWEYDNIDRWVTRTACSVPAGALFYRARPGYTRKGRERLPHSGTEIGAPPLSKCKPARVNDEGQRVLYCADQSHTAICEVRPLRGEYVSIGQVRLTAPLQIADLVNKLEAPNPFTTTVLRHEVEIHKVLRAFASQLSRPLDWRDDETDYIPCRYLADRIRAAGLSGIRYGSTMDRKGSNVVFFEVGCGEILNSSLVRVSEVDVKYTIL